MTRRLSDWLLTVSRRLGVGQAHGPVDALAALLSFAILYQFVTLPAVGEENLPSFEGLDPQVRKVEFFDYLRPIIRSVNDSIRQQRARAETMLRALDGDEGLSIVDRLWLRRMASRYRIDTDEMSPSDDELLVTLVDRIDVVPASLVLVQAAMESGWGTSRFAEEGNNLFGQRCFESGCGIVPDNRASGSRFEIATFDSVRGSIESYILNLNSHHLHEPLRKLRSRLRESGDQLTGLTLARGLQSYSERGSEYVAEIQSLIINNGLERL